MNTAHLECHRIPLVGGSPSRHTLALAGLSLCLVVVSCREPEPHGDADVEPSCIRTDDFCVDSDQCCDPDTHVCAAAEGEPGLCLERCEIADCDFNGATGTCFDLGGFGACIPDELELLLPSGCEPMSEGCETAYGTTSETICVPLEASSWVCVESCEPAQLGCDAWHVCVPLEDGGGVCLAL